MMTRRGAAVKEDGAFISVQNGINDYRLAESVTGGASRCVGCVTTVGNGCLQPGEVIRWDRAPHAFKFGEHDNSVTPRLHELKALFDREGSVTGGAEITENLWGARWSKLATNCYINVTAGLSGYKTFQVRTLATAIPIATAMAAECCQVAEALGVKIEPVMGLGPEFYTEALEGDPTNIINVLKEQAGARGLDAMASMLQDVTKHRRTEVCLPLSYSEPLLGTTDGRAACVGCPDRLHQRPGCGRGPQGRRAHSLLRRLHRHGPRRWRGQHRAGPRESGGGHRVHGRGRAGVHRVVPCAVRGDHRRGGHRGGGTRRQALTRADLLAPQCQCVSALELDVGFHSSL